MRKGTAPPRLLVVLSSSNQLYSGTGTALFDWIRCARQAIDFTIVIDTLEPRNAVIAAEFCRGMGLDFVPASGNHVPGCPDHGVRSIGRLFASQRWDGVECISWANAATNLDVLSAIGPATRLIFTPHAQPLWTLGDPKAHFMVLPVFRRMIARSDLVFLDAPNELDSLGIDDALGERAVWLPLGVDTAAFSFAVEKIERRVLCVCDFREPRKRSDLLFAAFGEAAREDAEIALTIAGSESGERAAPRGIADRVLRMGYVTREELVRQYRRCGVFVLLSDYEAFGLPIAEALCCGAPTIINRQPQLERIFGGLPGVRFVDNRDTKVVAQAMREALAQPQDRRAIAEAAAKRFSFAATYERKLDRVLSLLRPG